MVPLAAVIGELTVSGEALKRQLALGHSSYTLINPHLGFVTFVGVHHVLPGGDSAKYFWMIMRPDANVADPNHWLQTATQQEKYDYVSETVLKLEPKFREIFDMTPVEGIRKTPHVWRDLELDEVPAGRVVILGDAAHAMTPFRGEGGYHSFIDGMNLAETITKLEKSVPFPMKTHDTTTIKAAISKFNEEMLRRGADSVRFSRASHEEAKKIPKERQPFAAPMKLLPDVEIKLQTVY